MHTNLLPFVLAIRSMLRPVRLLRLLAWTLALAAAAAPPALAADNPLRTADAAIQKQARADAFLTFQKSCRPCHGNLGAGDGPYAVAFPQKASDLRRPSRDIATDEVRFERIRNGAGSFSGHPWETNMPAFGGELTDQEIWGLVLLLDDFVKNPGGIDSDAVGSDVYATRCAACHGETGRGDGSLAPELLPRPRDLARGPYRLRGTPSGSPPIDSDVIGVIAHGVGDTSMGRFLALGSQRLEDVVAHVQSLAPELFATKPSGITMTALPREPIAQLVTRGRAVYASAKCAECHGQSGRGDGPASASLKDVEGNPSIASNLTKQWTLKGGGSTNDFFRILTAGMDGTPMQSYASSLSPEDRWALGYYLEHIARQRARFSSTVHAAVVTEKLPLDPTAAFWRASPPMLVPLGPQMETPPYWTYPSIDLVEVVVAVNADQLGIFLTWDDRSRDVVNGETAATTIPAALARRASWRLSDAIAVQFPEKVDPKGTLPSPYLGDTKRPLRRWLWSADRQEKGDTRALVEQIAGTAATSTAGGDIPPVETAATWVDGQWRVVMLTKRPPKTVASLPMSIQAWDGAAGEAGTWRSFSAWLNLQLR